MSEVHQYINNETNTPLLLQGPSACGKSFLIANIASEVSMASSLPYLSIIRCALFNSFYLNSYISFSDDGMV